MGIHYDSAWNDRHADRTSREAASLYALRPPGTYHHILTPRNLPTPLTKKCFNRDDTVYLSTSRDVALFLCNATCMRIEYEPRHSSVFDETGTSRSTYVLARTGLFSLGTTACFALFAYVLFFGIPSFFLALVPHVQLAASAAAVDASFVYDFKRDGTLIEAKDPDASADPYLWLASGAKMILRRNQGATIEGGLHGLDIWRFRYAQRAALDTEGGYAPQNLFRLITRSVWENVRIEASFRITRDNFTESPRRNASNGLFLMPRYKAENETYLAGLRVDGMAVIRKKFHGTYVILAEKKIFEGEYVREKDINLLPHNEWIMLRSDTTTDDEGLVHITLFMKLPDETKWTELLRATDDETLSSSPPITGALPVGIRSDFMDVEFDNLRVDILTLE